MVITKISPRDRLLAANLSLNEGSRRNDDVKSTITGQDSRFQRLVGFEIRGANLNAREFFERRNGVGRYNISPRASNIKSCEHVTKTRRLRAIAALHRGTVNASGQTICNGACLV
jgi:hypothetical protein